MRRVVLDLDDDFAALLSAAAADANLSEAEVVERALRAMDLRDLVERIRSRSKLDENQAAQLVAEELAAARAQRGA